MNTVALELMKLLKKAVLNTDAEINAQLMNDELFDLAKRHKLANIIYPVVKEHINDARIKKELQEAYYKAMYRETIQETEYAAISESLEKENIDYLPLKGIVMKNVYPSPDMRTMIDIDILVREDDLAKISELMSRLGYGKAQRGTDHYAYYKEPIMNVEMHFTLISEAKRDGRFSYFSDWWSRAVKEEGAVSKWRLSDEDFFLYMIAHTAKHFMGGGCGIRSVFDIYLFQKKVSLDMQYVCDVLKSCELSEFYTRISELAGIWFDGGVSNDLYDTMTEYIVGGGYQGSSKNRALHEAAVTSGKSFRKRKYGGAVKKIFPPLKKMKFRYKWLQKFPFLLPIAWLHRSFSGLFNKQSYRIVSSSLKVEKEGVHMLESLYKELGLM